MIYHVLADLGPFKDGTVLKAGTKSRLRKVSKGALKSLLEAGAVSVWETPPLRIIPGWEKKALAFEGVGVTSIGDLVEADPERLAKGLRVARRVIDACIEEVQQYI